MFFCIKVQLKNIHYIKWWSRVDIDTAWWNRKYDSEFSGVLICSPLLSAGTQSQLNLERSKSRMGTFVEGGPMAEANPDEG